MLLVLRFLHRILCALMPPPHDKQEPTSPIPAPKCPELDLGRLNVNHVLQWVFLSSLGENKSQRGSVYVVGNGCSWRLIPALRATLKTPYPTPGLRDATLIGRNCYSFTTESGKCHPWGHLVLFLCFSYVFPPKRWLWLRVTTPLGKNKLFLTQSMLRNRNSCTNVLISYTFLGNAFQEGWLCQRVTIIEMIQSHL